MKKRIILVILLVLLIILGVAFQFYLKSTEIRLNAGGSAIGNKTITIDAGTMPMKIDIDLEIDNSQCNNELNYSIKTPNGDTMKEGTVKAHSELKLSTLEYKGVKGDWEIQFKKGNESNYFEYKYTIKTINNLF